MKARVLAIFFLSAVFIESLHLTHFSYEQYRTAGDGMRYQILKRWASEYHDPEQLFQFPEKKILATTEFLKNCIDSKLKVKKYIRIAQKKGLKPLVLQCLNTLES